MSADIRPFGTQSNGIEVSAIRLKSGELSATILTRGAILQELRLAGSAHSLTLGSDMLAAYEGPMAYFGAVVGPVANRIGGARAMIGGHLTGFLPNEGTTLLHSGAVGLHGRVWDIAEASAESVTLRLDLPDGVDGFPGNRELTARYSLSGQTLSLELQATSDAPSLMNLAHHGFWNLDGRADISGHDLSVNAEHYLPITPAKLPTGARAPVSGAFDLRQGRILDLSEGFDHNFCLSEAPRDCVEIARLRGRSGVTLRLSSTEPGLQVYDGKGMATAPFIGHDGQPYGRFGGLALEPQRWPDAPNHPDFPAIEIGPGAPYRQLTRFHFSRD